MSGFLRVHDIFYSVQGEGLSDGIPALFVRLAGCNLRCPHCDTDFHDARLMSCEDILNRGLEVCGGSWPTLVVLTGGEPLLQDVDNLVEALLLQGLRVEIETNGTRFRDCCRWRGVLVTVSPKGPVDPRFLYWASAFKIVVRAGEDPFVDGVLGCKMSLPEEIRNAATILVQPLDEKDPERNRLNKQWAAKLALENRWLLSLQIHKECGLP